MTKQTKNTPAAREDAEEEQRTPQAGDVLTEQDAYLLMNTRSIFENLGRNLMEENKRKEQALHRIDEITLESAGHKRRADEMAEEARLAHADIRRKDEIISRKDEEISQKNEEISQKNEEISRMRAESERKDAAHAEELGKLREENDQLNRKLNEFVAGYRVISDSAASLAQRYSADEKKNAFPAVLPSSSEAVPACVTFDEKIRRAITVMQAEGIFKYAYDYVWVMLVMNQTSGLLHFDSTPSFHCFLLRIGVNGLPTLASLKKKAATACRQHPGWTFTDTADANETRRRNNVASRFLSLVRKGA